MSSGIKVTTSEKEKQILAGKKLANPLYGEEVVIAGMSGCFPKSDNLKEYYELLRDKANMSSPTSERWKNLVPEMPKRSGFLSNISTFDVGFFGIGLRQARYMSLDIFNLTERVYECIVDAGVSPNELIGSKTGVFTATCYVDLRVHNFDESIDYLAGYYTSMIPNRISYLFQLRGPSYIVDSACSSSMYALDHAIKCIREGKIDNAIVTSMNLTLAQVTTLNFLRLGVLSPDGVCKSFDNSADGYCRSEGCGVLFLQKAKNARRIYATVVHSKTNCDGYKENGITFPSHKAQQILLEEFYQECDVEPSKISFLECHATGTRAGDPEEILAVDEVICKRRNKPLLVGSVKSNIGHCESTSGLASMIKVFLCMEKGIILPNKNYKVPRDGMDALISKRMIVVDEVTPWPDNVGIAAVNSFGFGGANGHVLFRWNKKSKPKEIPAQDDLPRFVCFSGRNENFLESVMDELRGRPLDDEFISLIHHSLGKPTFGNIFKGYVILSSKGELKRSWVRDELLTKELVCLYRNNYEKWHGMGLRFLKLPLFVEALRKSQQIFDKHNITVNAVKTLKANSKDDPCRNITTLLVQLALADVLKKVKAKPHKSSGKSFSWISSFYIQDFINLEQALLLAYNIFFATNDVTDKINKEKSNSIGRYLEDVLKYSNKLQQLLEKCKLSRANVILLKKIVDDSSAVALNESSDILLDLEDMKLRPGKFSSLNVYQTPLNEEGNDEIVALFDVLGRLYLNGFDLQIDHLYPKVEFPVSRGTPGISHLVKWNHNIDIFADVTSLGCNDYDSNCKRFVVSTDNLEWKFLKGHVIDGRNLFPATGFLFLVWKSISLINDCLQSTLPVMFEDVKFIRAVNLSKSGSIQFAVVICKCSGMFSIEESGSNVVTGRIGKLDGEMFLSTNTTPDTHEPDRLRFTQKDVYKELRLRGYQYSGLFRSIQSFERAASIAYVEWKDNYICFMDNMLQTRIIQEDRRSLFIPSFIKRICIDPKMFTEYLKEMKDETNVPVCVNNTINLIKCNAIEIFGLEGSTILRRKPFAEPVLETYRFVPNFGDLDLESAVRVNVQIILEQYPNVRSARVLEVSGGNREEENVYLAPLMLKVFNQTPLMQPSVKLLTDEEVTFENVTVEKTRLEEEKDYLLVVVSDASTDKILLRKALEATTDGFVLSREKFGNSLLFSEGDVVIVTKYVIGKEILLLLRRPRPKVKAYAFDFNVPLDNFSWVAKLKNNLYNSKNVCALVSSNPESGTLGFVNCLRRESLGEKVRCFLLLDENRDVLSSDLSGDFFRDQLAKGMAVNVHKDGKWGTYRHLLLSEAKLIETNHCISSLSQGELSSLSWAEGHLSHDRDENVVSVYFSALNFRDVMVASGRISLESTRDRKIHEKLIGCEFSGRRRNGRRVCGLVHAGALSSLVESDPFMTWDVPRSWSLIDAATVPCVYATTLYALLRVGELKGGESILIHAGAGGVGQSAINIATHFGCKIFTTVGTQEKRDFIRTHFPQIQDNHIGCSRDTSFEQTIMYYTKGKGVNLVLNSLSEEKLQASVRCLARGGRFLEIGKFDLLNDTQLNLRCLEKGASYYGIMVNHMMTGDVVKKKELYDILNEGLRSTYVKPLKSTVYGRNQIVDAFRFMSAGKHIGKVLIKMRKEEKDFKIEPKKFWCSPKFQCDPTKSVVIIGGLGGFGLELADWLILRNCQKLVLSSRNGIRTGYQSRRIRIWKSYGVEVVVSKEDVTTKEGCLKLLQIAGTLGPLQSIFNLGVVLKDALFENQTEKSFEESFGPKAHATRHLDELTRELVPDLRDFVVFSSVSCGKGNAGQTNYGMANSIMERICEKRKADGFSGLAIQWGAVGDVGLVAEMTDASVETAIGGTLQQRIASCVEVLDKFLRQKEPIVSSIVVAEKSQTSGNFSTPTEAVAQILGIRDVKTVSPHSTLPEIGMDSIMGTEIKQVLEKDFEIVLTAQEIKTLSFSKLKDFEMLQSRCETNDKDEEVKSMDHAFNLIFSRLQFDVDDSLCMTVKMKTVPNDNLVVIIPGLEGFSKNYKTLADGLKANVVCLQLPYKDSEQSPISFAKIFFKAIKTILKTNKKFKFICHSFGSLIAIHLVHMLEQEGYSGKVAFVDGSPDVLTKLAEVTFKSDIDQSDDKILLTMFSNVVPDKMLNVLKNRITGEKSLKEKANIFNSYVDQNMKIPAELYLALVNRIKSLTHRKDNFKRIKATSKLWKCDPALIKDYPDDYNLSQYCDDFVGLSSIDGDHLTILNSEVTIREINEFFEIL